jgi:hypothetical protein
MFATVRTGLALCGAALCAVGAGACGSSTSTSGSAPSNPTTHASAAAASTPAPATTAAPPASTSTAAPPANSGERHADSASPPHRSGGDESIQKFGREAPPSDKSAVAVAVKAYYAAVAADDGGASCALLSAGLQQSIVQSLGRAPTLRHKGCAGILTLFFGRRRGASISPAVTVIGVRLKGDHGFALISTRTAPTGEIPVVRENGEWKIGALIGSSIG